jgi:integrase
MPALIEDALPHLIAGKAPATQKLYRLAARKLQGILAEFGPHDVTPADVAQLRRGLSDTPGMANRCLSLLRMTFDWALEERLVPANPVVGVKRNPTRKRTRRLTLGEFAAIRAEASDRLQITMDLCLLTGQRIGDVLGIQRTDCLEEGLQFVQRKTGAALVVAWTPELRAAVDAAKRAHGRIASKWLVKGDQGRPLAYQPIWRDWKAACTAAGVAGATIHDLRAMAATEAKRQGLDAQALLGHRSERMTQQYLRDREIPVVQGPSFRRV